MTGRFKRHQTLFSGGEVQIWARERFLLHVHAQNVFLKSRVFPKYFAAWRVLGTAIFVLSIVCCEMSAQPCPGHEAFSASRSVADVVTNAGVGALNVVVEMRRSQEFLITAIVRTFKHSLIVMRT